MIERERKFLVSVPPADLDTYPHDSIEQGYLAIEDGRAEVRLRRIGGHDVLTIKRGRGASRLEKEGTLCSEHGRSLWPLTRGRRVHKVRYKIPYCGLTIELDVYSGKAQGLITAEVEFDSDDGMHRFDPPPWFGKEVTGRRKYTNSRIAVRGWKQPHTSRTKAFRLDLHAAISKGVKQIVREGLNRAVTTLDGRDGSSDVRIHEARKCFKEVRATMRLIRSEIGAGTFDHANKAVRDVARPLSEVRDAKVLIERLDSLNDQFKGRLNAEDVARLREHLVARRCGARARLVGATDTVPRIVRDSLAIRKRVKRWPIRRKGWNAIRDGLRGVYRQGRRASGNARSRLTDEAMHEWRKRAKDLQYEVQLLRDLHPSAMKRLADRLCHLTDLLGEDHDLAVLRAVVREVSKDRVCIDEEGFTAVIDQHRDALQRHAFGVGDKIYKRTPGVFLARLEHFWKKSRKKSDRSVRD
jgi:CYTH domain-containing protein